MVEPTFNQMQVQPEIGINFAAGVRTLLRQDPDIIMVGEIRDHETADMAVQAALTGHLVLSTLHTNDAPTAVTRLLDLGVPPYLIYSTLLGVMAQRLVRTLCPHCKEPADPPDDETWKMITSPWRAEKPAQVMGATGCLECRMTGYYGRMGLYEIMLMTIGERRHRTRLAIAKDGGHVSEPGWIRSDTNGWAEIECGSTRCISEWKVTDGSTTPRSPTDRGDDEHVAEQPGDPPGREITLAEVADVQHDGGDGDVHRGAVPRRRRSESTRPPRSSLERSRAGRHPDEHPEQEDQPDPEPPRYQYAAPRVEVCRHRQRCQDERDLAQPGDHQSGNPRKSTESGHPGRRRRRRPPAPRSAAGDADAPSGSAGRSWPGSDCAGATASARVRDAPGSAPESSTRPPAFAATNKPCRLVSSDLAMASHRRSTLRVAFTIGVRVSGSRSQPTVRSRVLSLQGTPTPPDGPPPGCARSGGGRRRAAVRCRPSGSRLALPGAGVVLVAAIRRILLRCSEGQTRSVVNSLP